MDLSCRVSIGGSEWMKTCSSKEILTKWSEEPLALKMKIERIPQPFSCSSWGRKESDLQVRVTSHPQDTGFPVLKLGKWNSLGRAVLISSLWGYCGWLSVFLSHCSSVHSQKFRLNQRENYLLTGSRCLCCFYNEEIKVPPFNKGTVQLKGQKH